MDDEDDVQSANAEETNVVAAEGICRRCEDSAARARAFRRSTDAGFEKIRRILICRLRLSVDFLRQGLGDVLPSIPSGASAWIATTIPCVVGSTGVVPTDGFLRESGQTR